VWRAKIHRARAGDIIDLDFAPHTINCSVDAANATTWSPNGTLQPGRVVIPVFMNKKSEDTVPIPPFHNLPKTEVEVLDFSVTLGFALTFDKTQGKTLTKVILDVNHRPFQPEVRYCSLYVGVSRVCNSTNIRFLQAQPAQGFDHLKKLQPDPKIAHFLNGFDPITRLWDSRRAKQSIEEERDRQEAARALRSQQGRRQAGSAQRNTRAPSSSTTPRQQQQQQQLQQQGAPTTEAARQQGGSVQRNPPSSPSAQQRQRPQQQQQTQGRGQQWGRSAIATPTSSPNPLATPAATTAVELPGAAAPSPTNAGTTTTPGNSRRSHLVRERGDNGDVPTSSPRARRRLLLDTTEDWQRRAQEVARRGTAAHDVTASWFYVPLILEAVGIVGTDNNLYYARRHESPHGWAAALSLIGDVLDLLHMTTPESLGMNPSTGYIDAPVQQTIIDMADLMDPNLRLQIDMFIERTHAWVQNPSAFVRPQSIIHTPPA
jgi:hypothetical protein